MNSGKKKVLTSAGKSEFSHCMEPRYRMIWTPKLSLLYGFDHDAVWAAIMRHIRTGRRLVSTEYTQMQHRRTHNRGILLQATFKS